MKTVFLSYHSAPPDEDIAKQMNALVDSHDLRTVTGEHLAGGGVAQKVKDLIDRSDALIALATADPNQPRANGKFNTFDWVGSELDYARGKGKPTGVIVHRDVELGAGLFADSERIAYNPDTPLAAFLKLSATLGIWKSDAGRTMQLMLVHDDLNDTIDGDLDNARCEYRIRSNNAPGQWKVTYLQGKVGGIVAYASGLKDDDEIEVQLTYGADRYYSRSVPQLLRVDLKKKKIG